MGFLVLLILTVGLTSCVSIPPLVAVPGGLVVATSGRRPRGAEEQVRHTLRALGFQVRTQPVRALARDGSPLPVFLPESAAAALSAEEVQLLRMRVEEGLALAQEGKSALAERLGITFINREVEVSGGRGSLRYELVARWKTPVRIHPFVVNAPATFLSPGGLALEAEGRIGRGRFVFFAVPVLAPDGQIRYPGLGEVLRQALGVGPPLFSRPAIETYFDPAYRTGVPPSILARLWRAQGIRAVHVAGWYGPRGYPYGRIVEALHRSGLRAYLWLTPPMVTRQLWDEHPECRERTASGADTSGDWRSLFALEDPACLTLALSVYQTMLTVAPWDGVDLAELYFLEPYLGATHPEGYTPFHAWVRGYFAAKYGFDPAEIFDPSSPHFHRTDPSALRTLEVYRAELLTDLHQKLLAFFLPRLQGKDLVVTLIDDILDPAVARNIGLDTRAVLALRRELPFRVLVEDPFTVWSREPERYARLRAEWTRRVRGGFSFDLNVVDRQEPNPTRRMGGAELARAVAAAADEVAIYAESSVYPDDWTTIQTALAAVTPASAEVIGVAGKVYTIRTGRMILFKPPETWDGAALDGAPSRLGGGGSFWIPPGTHTIAPGSLRPGWRVMRSSCEVLSAERGGEVLRYTSPSPCYAVLTPREHHPAASVDGRLVREGAWSDGEEGMILALPAGEHRVEFLR